METASESKSHEKSTAEAATKGTGKEKGLNHV
jgi:hypothetical protein